MSTPPPPPPFSPVFSDPASGRDVRQPPPPRPDRIARRQQRVALRAQARAKRHTSALGPILLIGLGVSLFLVQIGRLTWGVVMTWLTLWWPLVLVIAGLIVLGEWVLDVQRAGRSGAMAQRRSVGAGGIVLLAVVGLAGVGVSALRHGSTWASEHWSLAKAWGLDDWLAQHVEDTQTLQASLLPSGHLTIENFQGTVTVTGSSDDGQVHVTAHRRLWGWQGSELEHRRARDRATLTSDGAGLLLRTTGEGRDETDLTVEVPHITSVNLKASKGELSISELRGAVQVDDHAGNVVMTALTGGVHLVTHDDDAAISGRSITGDVTVDGRSGDLTFSDIDGPLTLHGDFFGTTHLERIQGPVHFQSSYTNLVCGGLPGELNIEGRSELEGRNLAGPVTLTTTERDVTLSELHRGATVRDQKGSVNLSFADLAEPVEVDTTDGSVKLQLPQKSAFHMEAKTEDGDIENDFGLSSKRDGDHVTLSGQVLQGGPAIRLHTTEGDVSLQSSEAAGAGRAQQKSEDDPA